MPSLMGGLLVSCPVSFWHLPMLGTPPSALLEQLPSSPLPSWQLPPLFSSSLWKPAPMTPLSWDPSVA